MATRCPLCNGRVIKSGEGERCMNAACDNAAGIKADDGIPCRKCGDIMTYRGLDTYGQPHYGCQSCGNKQKLSE